MGAFNITIKGFGGHHNRNQPGDANRIAQEFVHILKANGCDISLAEFQPTGGDAEDLRAVDYAAKYDDPVVPVTALDVAQSVVNSEGTVIALAPEQPQPAKADEVAIAAPGSTAPAAAIPTTEGNAGASTPAAPTDAAASPAVAGSDAPPAEGGEARPAEGETISTPGEPEKATLDAGLAAPGT